MPLKKVWDNLAGNWDLHPFAIVMDATAPKPMPFSLGGPLALIRHRRRKSRTLILNGTIPRNPTHAAGTRRTLSDRAAAARTMTRNPTYWPRTIARAPAPAAQRRNKTTMSSTLVARNASNVVTTRRTVTRADAGPLADRGELFDGRACGSERYRGRAGAGR